MGSGLRVGMAMERRSWDWACIVARMEESLVWVVVVSRS